MRDLLLLAVLLGVCAAASKYTDRYDDIDIDEIISNDRLLKTYVACLLNEPGARCSPEGNELKKHLREALENECQRCTDKQQKNVRKVMGFLEKNHPDTLDRILAIYDPNFVYRNKQQKHK